jgi:hypothetical protein
LYSTYASWGYVNDVTVGNTKCATTGIDGFNRCCSQGFYAGAGWDPATVSGVG